MKTPLLLLVFNRPQNTRALLRAIEKIKPGKIYISADGPRIGNSNDKKRCEETRAIFSELSWPCEVIRWYNESNKGCGRSVSDAISRFFSLEEMGIILEDDCIPSPDFFSFCEQLLDKYRQDESVMHISGTNFQLGRQWGNGSYYFSRYAHVWGWATWRRAWKYYDFEMTNYPDLKKDPLFRKLFPDDNMELTYNKQLDTWDHQWSCTIFGKSGKCIIPNLNLVKNTGFDTRSATHTKSVPWWFSRMKYGNMPEITTPSTEDVNNAADEFTLQNIVLSPKGISGWVKKRYYKILGIIKR